MYADRFTITHPIRTAPRQHRYEFVSITLKLLPPEIEIAIHDRTLATVFVGSILFMVACSLRQQRD